MGTVYTFDNKAHYNNASATNSLGASFVLTSESMAKVTTVRDPNGKQAAINWRDRTFDLDGRTWGIDDLRSIDRRPGISFGVRRWSYNKTSWHVKYEYEVKTWHVWRLVNGTPEERTTMDFQVYQSKIIGKSIPATIVMDSSLLESDALLLWMAVIYSEVTQHPRPSLTRDLGDNIARGITAALRIP